MAFACANAGKSTRTKLRLQSINKEEQSTLKFGQKFSHEIPESVRVMSFELRSYCTFLRYLASSACISLSTAHTAA